MFDGLAAEHEQDQTRVSRKSQSEKEGGDSIALKNRLSFRSVRVSNLSAKTFLSVLSVLICVGVEVV